MIQTSAKEARMPGRRCGESGGALMDGSFPRDDASRVKLSAQVHLSRTRCARNCDIIGVVDK